MREDSASVLVVSTEIAYHCNNAQFSSSCCEAMSNRNLLGCPMFYFIKNLVNEVFSSARLLRYVECCRLLSSRITR